MKIAVCGAGGFVGGHLVKALLDQGHEVRASDIKPLRDWWQEHEHAHNFSNLDLSNAPEALAAVAGMDQVYDLAEHMGGISFIESNKVACAESIQIGIALLRACVVHNVGRFFYSSSACVYPTHIQQRSGNMHSLKIVHDLNEEDAWPARPEEGYGFSKLYMEELCRHYSDTYGIDTRVARYHNVYGSPGSWCDGKEKSPAALCRKVAEAVHGLSPSIEVWGDGRQIRSYLHVSDCVRGTLALMASDYSSPVNIGSDRAVSIGQLLTMIETTAGALTHRTYNMNGAQGVDGRNADIGLAKELLDWAPQIELEEGIAALYRWIEIEVLTRSASSDGGTSLQVPTTVAPAS
jgi:GDP-D-mannose 3',5'-epimerase